MKRHVGRPIPRVEDYRFLTGGGCYTDDVRFEGQLWCAFLRSPHAHARIVHLGSSRARRAPGVGAVLTGADHLADGFAGIEHAANPVDALGQILVGRVGKPDQPQLHLRNPSGLS
jgi:aerobic carbon-monoxide dehydrogenase large subunit